MKRLLLLYLFLWMFFSCKTEGTDLSPITSKGDTIAVEYAKNFTLINYEGYKILNVRNPWPNATKGYTYLLVEDEGKVPAGIEFNSRINIPVEKLVVTSTTHIPSLEALEKESVLVGFPGLEYISSEKVRQRINQNKITELGRNEAINTEVLIALQPDAVVGFAVNATNQTYNIIEKSGIPVIFNGDWTEESPLGKAEWIKFFGALLDRTEEAENIFNSIANSYQSSKALADTAKHSPSVISGSMYKDQWYVPYGNSWQARFIQDANGRYIYEDTKGNGSRALAFETVLAEAGDAEFWIAPGHFKSFEELEKASSHYRQFKAVQNTRVYTYSKSTGETGGVTYYELAPNRPDLVLKDLISIFHPQLLPGHQPVFFKPLD